MNTILLEMEGTAEEVQERLSDFAGQRLSITVRTQEPDLESQSLSLSGQPEITTIILELFKDAPPIELAKVPADFVGNIDHYLYNLPKK